MCALNYQIQPTNIRRIPFKAMTSFFHFHNPLPARAAMTDAARQAYNAKARRRMAIPDNLRRANASRAKSRAAMSDSTRQAENATTRTRIAIPANLRKARERRGKVSAERSAIVPVVHGRMQKGMQHDAFLGKEISDGVCEILALEPTDDSIGKLVDVMWQIGWSRRRQEIPRRFCV